MSHPSSETLAGLPARIMSFWHRMSEVLHETFTMSRKLSIITIASCIVAGIAVYLSVTAMNDLPFISIPNSPSIDNTFQYLGILGILLFGFILPLMLSRPEIMILFQLLLYNTVLSPIITESLLRVRNVPIMTLLILISAIYTCYQWLALGKKPLIRLKSSLKIVVSLFLILTVGVVALVHCIVGKQSLVSLSAMTCWLAFFIISIGFTKTTQVRFLKIALVLICVITCVFTALQSFYGFDASFFLKLGRWDIQISDAAGLFRVVPPGYLLLPVGIALSLQMALNNHKVISIVWWSLFLIMLTLALVATMYRNMWAGTGLSCAIVLVASLRVKNNLNIYIISMCLLFGSMLYPVIQSHNQSLDILGAIGTRVQDIDTAGDISTTSSSLGSRAGEVRSLYELWKTRPIVGVGYDTPYQYTMQRDTSGMFYEIQPRMFVHDSFMWFLGKSGIIGLIGYLLLCGGMIFIGGKRCISMVNTDPNYNWAIGLWAGMMSFIVASVFDPVFSSRPDFVLPIAISIGLFEVVTNGESDTIRKKRDTQLTA